MELLKRVGAGLAAAAIATVVAVSARDGAGVDLAISGRANLNPSIAASDSFVAVAWGAAAKDGPTDVFVAISHDAGRSFRAPVRVNDIVGDARLSGEQPPRVSLVPRRGLDPSLVVVWTAPAVGGTRLLQAKSDDGGMSFSRAAALPGGDAAGNRGWESTTVDRDGHVVAVWLDHREVVTSGKASAPMHHDGQEHTGHVAMTDGAARAQLSQLYFSRLDRTDDSRSLTGGVCYCCKTAVAAGSDGSLYASWRHVYPGNVRDIAFTVSRDNGRTFAPPVRVSDDRWVLDGCPENGPSMAIDASDRVHIVWPTLVGGATPGSEPTLALFYASSDGGQFTARRLLPTEGLPRHPQMAVAGGSMVATWDEQINGTRRVVVARGAVNGGGPIRFTREIVGAQSAVYPTVAAGAKGVVMAWTSGSPEASVIHVTRVVAGRASQ